MSLLAKVETNLPPIVVHRGTMRVIDGMHRLRAAELRGNDVIEVLFFEGAESDTFALAVELNHDHGLPLSRADRTAAATRLLASHPEWSNRRIAAVTGLSATTVGALRERSTVQNDQLDGRVGKDGRVRPSDGAEGRQRASEFIALNPTASLREVAKAAGVSPTTVSDVRARLDRGERPTLPSQRDVPQVNQRTPTAAAEPRETIANLRRDPSLRFTEAGRVLLRFLDAGMIDADQWDDIIESVPAHQWEAVAHLARTCAGSWQIFANRLARRMGEASPRGPRSA